MSGQFDEVCEEGLETHSWQKTRRALLKKWAGTTGIAALATVIAGGLPVILRRAQARSPGWNDRRKTLARRFGMVIDLQRCIGCRACTVACKAENVTPPGVSYTVVLEEEIGTYPNYRRRFLSKPCFHCENPSCVPVCPVKATYKRKEDGIVVIDYDKCIGCRYCITACPYGSRFFDFGENYPAHDETPYGQVASPEYGQNRRREGNKPPVGVTRKCTFCLHRLEKGLNPACVETCMGRALHFGDFNDPTSEVNRLIASRNTMRLKEDLGNEPNVYYLL